MQSTATHYSRCLSETVLTRVAYDSVYQSSPNSCPVSNKEGDHSSRFSLSYCACGWLKVRFLGNTVREPYPFVEERYREASLCTSKAWLLSLVPRFASC